MMVVETSSPFLTSLVAGGTAGLVVDVTVYPLDTLKTRLQGKEGFRLLGGFNNLFKGIGPVVVGSVPHAALFFCTYDSVKALSEKMSLKGSDTLVHMGAASLGEVVACVVGVPVEVVKQRRQVSNMSSGKIVQRIWNGEGGRGFYRGYLSTLSREVPFSLIQMPLWELFKEEWSRVVERNLRSEESAVCGSMGGVVAAVITNPLDVVKTRIMLAEGEMGPRQVLRNICQEEGLGSLFAGVVPRTVWIAVGGLIFFGVYEEVKLVF
eukprot:GFUD01095387.1.p1 GENE.GFUD01095387.1~~GFUD01095387.1.p1  ORF type:complete len:265 (+),score=60.11 GFUD01095387.1:42-836(+)